MYDNGMNSIKQCSLTEIPESETEATERFLSLAEESVRYNLDAAVPLGSICPEESIPQFLLWSYTSVISS